MPVLHVILNDDSNCIEYHFVLLKSMPKTLSQDPNVLESFEEGFLPGSNPFLKLPYFVRIARHTSGDLRGRF